MQDERIRVLLAFRAGLLLGTVNLARDLGLTLDDIAEVTRVTPDALAAWTAQATWDGR